MANYPFATIEPNVGVVEIPDERLEGLVQIVRNDFGSKAGDREIPKKVIPSSVKFYDIAGLVKGAHKGEGLGNEFLGHIREVSALVQVIRDFEDENVIRSGSVSPQDDKSVVETELILSDLFILEKMLSVAKNDAKSRKSEAIEKVAVLERFFECLNQGKPLRLLQLDEKEEQAIRGINLLTRKPVIFVFNISEQDLISRNTRNPDLHDYNEVYISAKIESEICSLPEDEQKEYLKELGMEGPGLNRLIKLGYRILGLQSFLTAGPKEVRAWTVRQEASAPEAAGVIHSDFERGFIGADVISYSDLIKVMSFKKARDQGLIRLEGRKYIMKDGDVVEFRFNV